MNAVAFTLQNQRLGAVIQPKAHVGPVGVIHTCGIVNPHQIFRVTFPAERKLWRLAKLSYNNARVKVSRSAVTVEMRSPVPFVSYR